MRDRLGSAASRRRLSREWTVFGVAVSLTLVGAPTSLAKPLARTQVVTERGVGGLTIGRPLAAIQADGLIGPLSPGCELASPRPYGAKLRAPLKGFASFSGRGASSKLQSLSLTGGASTSRGITIGATSAAVRLAYPTARVENSRPGDPIEIYAIVLSRGSRDRIWFRLSRRGGRVTFIDIPGPEICE